MALAIEYGPSTGGEAPPASDFQILITNHNQSPRQNTGILQFAGVPDGCEVYNPAPVNDRRNNKQLIFARWDKNPNVEFPTFSGIFGCSGNDIQLWELDKNFPIFKMQDPHAAFIGNTVVVGGVHNWREPGNLLGWMEVFYIGNDLEGINPEDPWFYGVPWRKGTRFVETNRGKIGMYYRTQGSPKELCQLRYAEVDHIKDLPDFIVTQTTGKLTAAEKIVNLPFGKGEWGGVNQVLLLENGHHGVTGHAAFVDNYENKHYYEIAFEHDPISGMVTNLRIVSASRDFILGPNFAAKKPELEDVVYPGGLLFLPDMSPVRLCGIKDRICGFSYSDEEPYSSPVNHRPILNLAA